MFIPELYSVQKKFISDCTSTINNSEIGIFSSPTGTGKTLSLLLSVIDFITETEEEDLLIEQILGNICKTKIYFCSRTHFQLKQCINEFKKLNLKTNSVILGSRKIYCINREIDNKDEIDKVNQKCKNLRKSEECEFYKNDMLVSGILDIEELVKKGRKNKTCPYYFSKKYFKRCELVFLPYNLLFNEESRNSLGINLINNIVIIDEAHNIIETVNSINTKIIYFESLEKYLKIFTRFKNNKIVSKFVEILQILLKYKNSLEGVFEINTFLYESDLLHFNMLSIVEDLKSWNLLGKLDSSNTKIFDLLKFLTLLVNSDTNCKVEISKNFIKIFPIDSKLYFEPFFDCQSVIFAGGTMEPINFLKDIFKTRSVKYFSYNSVATDFKGFLISSFEKKFFELTEKTRDSDFIQMSMKEIIAQFSKNIQRGGIVIFVPSKYYLEMLKKIILIKNIFYENYDSFDDYKKKVKKESCVLIAVMGGKLSEGMNFNDELCRVLVIFGVPFPNLTVEISEKVKFFGNDFLLQNTIKKVNQTIGRAIRHKNDYACIYLIDNRYVKYKNEISPWFRKKCKTIEFKKALEETKNFLKRE